MGAFLAGMLGAAGADIEKQSDRAYQEKRQERMDRMKILELAAGNPSFKPEDLGNLFNSLQDVADDAHYKSENKAIKDPFKQIGHFVEGIWKKREQKQAQQAIADQAKSDVEGAPGVTTQPQMKVPGIAGGQYNVPAPTQAEMAQAQAQPQQQQYKMVPRRGYTPPMPDSRFDFSKSFRTQAEQDEMARKARKESFETGLEEGTRTSQAKLDQQLKEVDQLQKRGYSKAEAERIVFGKAAFSSSGNVKAFFKRPGSDETEMGFVDKNNPGGFIDVNGEPVPGAKVAASPTQERLYGLMQAFYWRNRKQGLNDVEAREAAGEQVYKMTGIKIAKTEQEMAIASIRSGVGPGPGIPESTPPGAPPARPGAQTPRPVTPAMPPSRVAPRAAAAAPAQPTAATAPLRSKLNPREQENAQFYINSLTGGPKATGISQARAIMGQQALQKLGVTPEDLNARAETRKAAGKALEKLTLITASNEGLENALKRHGQVLISLRDQLPDSDVTKINEWLIKGGREFDVSGLSEKAVRYGPAIQALRNEYGRVIAGGAASVATTPVEALHEAGRNIREGFTRKNMKGLVDQLGIETQQRKGGYKDELARLQAELRAPLVPELTGGTYQPIESVPQPGQGQNDPLGILK